MATRRKRKTTPKAKFMVLDEDNQSCCGQEFPSFDAAVKEAEGHMRETVEYGVSGEDVGPFKIVQVVGLVKGLVKEVEFTTTKL